MNELFSMMYTLYDSSLERHCEGNTFLHPDVGKIPFGNGIPFSVSPQCNVNEPFFPYIYVRRDDKLIAQCPMIGNNWKAK